MKVECVLAWLLPQSNNLARWIETKSDVHHPILIRWFELFDWANAGLTARNPNPGFDSQRHNFNINDYSIDCDLFLFYDILSIGLLTTEM